MVTRRCRFRAGRLDTRVRGHCRERTASPRALPYLPVGRAGYRVRMRTVLDHSSSRVWWSGSWPRSSRTWRPPCTCTGRSPTARSTLRQPATHAFRFVIWVATGIRPRQWVAVHRKHHAFTDVEGDPHSPVLHGWLKVQMLNLAMYRREARNAANGRALRQGPPAGPPRPAVLRPRARRPRPRHGRRCACCSAGRSDCIAAFVHVNYYIGGSAAVNAIGHHFGRRPYDNNAGNLQWLAFVDRRRGAAQQPPRRSRRRRSWRTAGSRSTPGGG